MAKALELYLASDLTPLQKAALKRIAELKEELAGYGLHVRSAIELEFTTENEHGMPMPKCIKLSSGIRFDNSNPALVALKELFPAQDAAYLENFHYEYIRTDGSLFDRGQPEVPYQYEINIADPMAHGEGHPEMVAAITQDIIKTKLADLLKRGTCLQNPAIKIYPNMGVRPYHENKHVKSYFPEAGNITSSLHINVSLYDKNNNNLFAADEALLRHCAQSLLELQHSAALGMIPRPSSLARFDKANNSVATKIHASYETRNDSGKKGYSVHIRKPYGTKGLPLEKMQGSRLENRLPGSDADPFVAMAITLAALADGLKKQHTPVTALGQFEIPATHADLARNFTSQKTRDLLGPELYQAIEHEYAQAIPLAPQALSI